METKRQIRLMPEEKDKLALAAAKTLIQQGCTLKDAEYLVRLSAHSLRMLREWANENAK